MAYEEPVTKVQKHFVNFAKEEQWLQKKLKEGWILDRFIEGVQDSTVYTFKRVTHEAQKKRVYKIDYREFDLQNEYDEYVDMFMDSGWFVLSNQDTGKHICFANSDDVDYHIFSDRESFKQREQRMMQAMLRNTYVYSGILITFIAIYLLLGNDLYIIFGLVSAIAGVRSFIIYLLHRKTLHKLHKKYM